MATGGRETKQTLHSKLMVRLKGEVGDTGPNFETLKQIITTSEDIGLVECDTFTKLWKELKIQGLIRIGEYSFLIEQFTIMRWIHCVDIIKEYNKKIEESQEIPPTLPNDTKPREWKQLKKCNDVSFLKDHPQRLVVHRMKNLYHSNHLATLGKAKMGAASDRWSDSLYCHDAEHSTLTCTINNGVHPANDMAIAPSGELLVARPETSCVRVFDPSDGTFYDNNDITDVDGMVIDNPLHIETSGSHNMFLITNYTCNNGHSNSLLLVVNSLGEVIQKVQLNGVAKRMTFNPRKEILYIAVKDRLDQFYWKDDHLRTGSSSAHGVTEFSCGDVALGSGDEVLVAGWMSGGHVRIYQVSGEDRGAMSWRQIAFRDGRRRSCNHSPCICCTGDDNLWLGYDDKVEKFKLL